MASVYVTSQNDRLDRICKDQYGSEQGGTVEAVLNANPFLAKYGSLYAAGISITLPRISSPSNTSDTVSLWS
jgi:phage tail protein X